MEMEKAKLVVDVWKKIVQTQEHFNEMCMRVRTMFATVIAAILSLYGIVLKNGEASIHAYGFSVNGFLLVCLAITISSYLFYFVDRHWYHRLLVGSVEQGAAIESDWAKDLPEIQLGSKISAASPVSLNDRPMIYWLCRVFVRDPKLKLNRALHSDGKIEIFYKPLAWLSIAAAVIVVLTGGVARDLTSNAPAVSVESNKGQRASQLNAGVNPASSVGSPPDQVRGCPPSGAR